MFTALSLPFLECSLPCHRRQVDRGVDPRLIMVCTLSAPCSLMDASDLGSLCSPLSARCTLLSALCSLPYAISSLLSAIHSLCSLPSSICSPLSAFNHLLSALTSRRQVAAAFSSTANVLFLTQARAHCGTKEMMQPCLTHLTCRLFGRSCHHPGRRAAVQRRGRGHPRDPACGVRHGLRGDLGAGEGRERERHARPLLARETRPPFPRERHTPAPSCPS